MKIHNDDGTLNPDLARRELATAAKVTNPTDRAGNFELIKVSALIDIAASLKGFTLGEVAFGEYIDDEPRIALNHPDGTPKTLDEVRIEAAKLRGELPSDFEPPADDETPPIVGDYVVVIGAREPRAVGTILDITVSEDEYVALVSWPDGRPESKLWLSDLERANVIINGDEVDAPVEPIEPPREELDADFDGDAHPEAEGAKAKLIEAEGPRCGLEFYAEGQPDDVGICTRRAGHKAGKHSVTRVD